MQNEGLIIDVASEVNGLKGSSSNSFSLSLTERMVVFAILNVLGFVMQTGSAFRFTSSVASNDPSRFAFVYSLANVLSITGTGVLTGFRALWTSSIDPSRRGVSFIYFGAIAVTIVSALMLNSQFGKSLVTLGVITQMITYWFYILTYVPCGNRIASGCIGCIRGLF